MVRELRIATTLAALLALSMPLNAEARWGGGSWGGGSWGGGSWGGGSWGGGSWGGGSWGGGSRGGGSWGGGSWGGSWGRGHRVSYASGGSYGGSAGWRPGALIHRMRSNFHARHHAGYGGASWGSYGSNGGYAGGYYASAGSYGGYGSQGGYAYASPARVVYNAQRMTYADSGYVTASPVVYGGEGVHTAYYAPQTAYASDPAVVDDCCGGSARVIDGQYEDYQPQDAQRGAGTEGVETPPPATTEDDKSAAARWNRTATISVDVPADAIVFVNGYQTTSSGAQRRFLSAGLDLGERYSYEVRAVVNRNGEQQDATRTVMLTAGASIKISFDDLEDVQPTLTTLKLHVPEDATVTLAGQETSLQGGTRVYSTDQLVPGQAWEDYAIQVTVLRNGEVVTKERTCTIRAGETHELSLFVDEAMVAAR